MNTNPLPALAPCPFCRATAQDYRVLLIQSGQLWRAYCRECDAPGPQAETKLGAVNAWNRRPA